MTKKLLKPSYLLLIFSFLFSGVLTYAQGDLMVMPKRIIFDGSQRSHEINLANTGSETAVYAISFVNYKMTENGQFEQVEEPEEGQRFAEDFLRYFPRRVSLRPNEAQTLRVQLTRTGNLEPGEYRSHMYFRAVDEETALGQEEAGETDGISLNIKTVFGISIPIIVRHGESTTQMTLSDVSLNQEEQVLSLVLNRAGNMSVYGNIEVVHHAPDGTTTEVGRVKGVSVYTPNEKRNFSFQLRNAEGVDLSTGELKISYSEEGGNTLATTALQL